MSRSIILMSLALVTAGVAGAVTGGADPVANVEFRLDERVFAVMCAAHLGGYDLGLDTEPEKTLRRRVLAELENRRPPDDLRDRLKDFVHRRNVEMNMAAQQPKYVAFGLLLGPPPAFTFQPGTARPPAEVTALAGFEALVAETHRTLALGELWGELRPELELFQSALRAEMVSAMRDVLDFARQPARLQLNRRLVVIPDPIDRSGSVTAIRDAGTHYLLVSPAADPARYHRFFARAYLHFLIEPVFDERSEHFESGDVARLFAARPDLLEFRNEPGQAVLRSLVNAFERLLARNAGWEERDSVAAPFVDWFLQRLAGYADGAADLETVAAAVLDAAEPAALAAAAPSRQPVVRPDSPPELPTEDPRRRVLAEAERGLRDGRLDEVETLLAGLLAADPGDPNALFGMGQARYARHDFPAALEYYRRVSERPDLPAWLLGWSRVKAGHCLVQLDRVDEARAAYQKAADVLTEGDQGAADSARQALEELARRESEGGH